jgi:pimeloyl-ACP methyl ester carboxylesterase
MAASEPTLTADDLGGITAPTLVLVGDDDGISLAHTCALYESLPHGQLCVLPAASHAVVVEQAELTTRMISEFLARPASPTTLIPIRRRG